MRALIAAAAAALALGLTLLAPAAASAQSAPAPTPAPTSNPGDVLPSPVCANGQCTFPDPSSTPSVSGACPGGVSGVLCDIEHGVVNGIVGKVTSYFTLAPLRRKQAASIRYWLGVFKGLLVLPNVASQSRVRDLWLLCLAIANVFFVVLLIAGGASSMAWEVTHLEPKDVVPRFALAWVLANLSVLAVGGMIGVTNALSHLLAQTTPDAMQLATERVVVSGALPFLFPGAIALLCLGLVGVRIFTIILIALLTIVGGPVHVAAVFPQSAGIAKSWWKAQIALIASGPVMMLIVAIGTWVLFTGDRLLSAGTVVDAFELLSLLFLLVAVPLWMLSRALKPVMRSVRDYQMLRATAALAKGVLV